VTTYTLDQYARLKQAYGTGQLSVRYEDKSVTYRTAEEMERILQRMERELGIATAQPRERRRYLRYDKGL
jgi:hypothetical protein